MGSIWHDYLYTPLLNTLFYLYEHWAGGNLGVAVVELTVLLRVALLPVTFVSERDSARFEKLNVKIEGIERDFKNDKVMQSEKIRELLRAEKVNYWAQIFQLGVQALVLVLLYQVFIGGIRFTQSEALYAWVDPPSARINTMFLGYDIAAYDYFWPLLVGGVLFLEIYVDQKRREHLVTRSDVMYLIFFPLASAGVLMLLPIVKSVFILTSLFFSILVGWIRHMIVRPSKG